MENEKPKRKLTTEERVRLLETQNEELLAAVTVLKEQVQALQWSSRIDARGGYLK
jgi:hypothetical protein